MKCLVTGAGGFVGKAVCKKLLNDGHTVIAPCRAGRKTISHPELHLVRIADLQDDIDWYPFLHGVDVVIHLAARVHIMSDKVEDPLAEFRKVNVFATEKLAQHAARSGVKRFVYISSIKVNGEETLPGRPFTAEDPPQPVDPYGISKYEAENVLRQVARETTMEVVIVRPPLVYGPDVRANFLAIMRWLKISIPLPFGAIHNMRSLVFLDNLVDLICTCIDHPHAANETFLVSDGEDLSTTGLLRRLAGKLGVPARLLPVPASMVKVLAILVGKSGIARRLCGCLQIDISKNLELLGWEPVYSVDAGLQKTVDWYLGNGNA